MMIETFSNQSELFLVLLAVYAQIGLFFCFFIPSGGFMFTAGVLVASGHYPYSLFTLCSLLTLAAIAGNLTAYGFGKKTASYLQQRKDARFFKQQYLQSAAVFFKKYGDFALAAGLFFPLLRTFVPIFAGIVRLNLRRFMFFSSLGSIAYVLAFVLTGYLIGMVPALKPYIGYIVVALIATLTIPVIWRLMQLLKKTD